MKAPLVRTAFAGCSCYACGKVKWRIVFVRRR